MVINTLFVNNNKMVIKSLQGDTFILFRHGVEHCKTVFNFLFCFTVVICYLNILSEKTFTMRNCFSPHV